tara:strand:+ start:4010 stop:4204 length:195 start_codon:yes stop_codon:yes gene_type:complete
MHDAETKRGGDGGVHGDAAVLENRRADLRLKKKSVSPVNSNSVGIWETRNTYLRTPGFIRRDQT